MKFKKRFVIVLILTFVSVGLIFYNIYDKKDVEVINGEIVLGEENNNVVISDSDNVTEQINDKKEEKVIKPNYNDLKRLNSAGAIDFEITFMNPKNNNEEFWVFQVAMNTHSVDLDAIPFEDLIYFEDDYGNVIDHSITYVKEGSGHHISQFIKLPKQINGDHTILNEYQDFKLIMENIEKVPQITFSWNMTLYPDIFNN